MLACKSPCFLFLHQEGEPVPELVLPDGGCKHSRHCPGAGQGRGKGKSISDRLTQSPLVRENRLLCISRVFGEKEGVSRTSPVLRVTRVFEKVSVEIGAFVLQVQRSCLTEKSLKGV